MKHPSSTVDPSSISTVDEVLLSRQETARRIGFKAQTLAKWAMSNRYLTPLKIGRVTRYRRSEVEQFIASRASAATQLEPVEA